MEKVSPVSFSTVSLDVEIAARPQEQERSQLTLTDCKSVWNLQRVALINWFRFALAIFVLGIQCAVVAIFFVDPNSELAKNYPLGKSILGFIFGLLMFAFWNRVRFVVSLTQTAAATYTEQKQNNKINGFPGIKLSKLRYYTFVIASFISCAGSLVFTVTTALTVKDGVDILNPSGLYYNSVVALLSLYSCLLATAVCSIFSAFFGSHVVLLLVRTLPRSLYPVGLTFNASDPAKSTNFVILNFE